MFENFENFLANKFVSQRGGNTLFIKSQTAFNLQVLTEKQSSKKYFEQNHSFGRLVPILYYRTAAPIRQMGALFME